jgi:hypothetical protein
MVFNRLALVDCCCPRVSWQEGNCIEQPLLPVVAMTHDEKALGSDCNP